MWEEGMQMALLLLLTLEGHDATLTIFKTATAI
jgi:hypothetical protein